jgi:hypothetical protein
MSLDAELEDARRVLEGRMAPIDFRAELEEEREFRRREDEQAKFRVAEATLHGRLITSEAGVR